MKLVAEDEYIPFPSHSRAPTLETEETHAVHSTVGHVGYAISIYVHQILPDPGSKRESGPQALRAGQTRISRLHCQSVTAIKKFKRGRNDE